MGAIPCIPLVLTARGAAATATNTFGARLDCAMYLYFLSFVCYPFYPPVMRFLIMSCLNLWSSDMKTLLLKSSIITSLCCVPSECASYIYFFFLPDMPWLWPPLFSLCGFCPDHCLGSRPARSSDHTLGGNENTPKPFWVFFQVACSVELLHVMLWLAGILFLSHVVVGCFLLPPLQTLMSDPIPRNHNVIYTCMVGLIICLVFLFAT